MTSPLHPPRLWILALFPALLCVACSETDPELLPEKCISSVFEGDVFLSSQASVDEFGKSCYVAIDGILQIGEFDKDSDINDLSPLKEIRRVSELKVVSNPDLQSLKGLEGLKQVEERILIHENSSLSSIEQLSSIKNEHISVTVYRNESLNTLDGLQSIRRYNNLDLVENIQLQGLQSLSNTERINCLYLEKNLQLSSLDGLENLNSLNCLYITQNPNLVDYCALRPVFSSQGNDPQFLCTENGFDITFEDLEQGQCSR
jgi:hypothetical protein